MPMEVAAIRNRVATVTVPMGEGEGESIIFTYYPAKASMVDQADIDRLNEQAKGQGKREQRRVIAAFLCDLAAGWDVTENKVPIPLDPDVLAEKFDDAFLSSVTLALISQATAGKVNGEVLSALGTTSTAQTAEASTESPKASPDRTAAEVSHPKSNLPKSPANRALRRGSLRSIPNGSPSSLPA